MKSVTVFLMAVLLGTVGLLQLACTQTKKTPKAAAPPATFTGPQYLHGTVGSMAKMQGFEPVLVSGFGVVVDLSGTGSSEVPARLRVRLINEMARKGMGSVQHNAQRYSPSRVLDSRNTAVVAVEGLIPPGATKGTRFDVLVSALPQTQTTSLAGGLLYTTDLAIGGTTLEFRRPLAEARGSSYVPPMDDKMTDRQRYDFARQAVVVAGGEVKEDMPLKLVLNQPSWTRSRLIAERINERYKAGRGERDQTAVAKTDLIVEVNVPERFAGDVPHFLGLLQHLYVQRGFNFEQEQARRLGLEVTRDPTQSERVALAWEGLGKTAIPVIGRYYEHPDLSVRLASLEAGVRLGDVSTLEHLRHLAGFDDPKLKRHAAALIVEHPVHVRAVETLKRLLNDRDKDVRLATYEAMAMRGDSLLLQRVGMGEPKKEDFILDIVDSQRPGVHLSQTRRPRVVVFNSYVGFNLPMVAGMWDGRLLIKAMESGKPMQVYYRPANSDSGKTYEIAPTVANLVFLLGHQPSFENPTDGLGLSFNHVVDALNELEKGGHLQAKLDIEQSALVQQLASAREEANLPQRPEVSGLGEMTTGDGDDFARPDVTTGSAGEKQTVNNDRSGLMSVPTP